MRPHAGRAVARPRSVDRLSLADGAVLLVIGPHELPPLPASLTCFVLAEPARAAQDLYVVLHQCDELGSEQIVVVPPPDRPEWRAVRDRLWRATRPIS